VLNVKPTTPYRDLKAADKVRRNLGDITQNVARTVANTALAAPNLVRKCLGREASWVSSYHAQRLALRETLRPKVTLPPETLPLMEALPSQAEAKFQHQEVLQQEASYAAGDALVTSTGAQALPDIPQNAPQFALDGSHAPPPRHRAPVTRTQVQSVLGDMGLNAVARKLDCQPNTISEGGLYESIRGFYRDCDDPRFKSGIILAGKGRELLAGYYARKYGASVEITGANFNALAIGATLPALIAADRQKAGDVRCAHYFGDFHGAAVIYIRQSGKEAILFFNTIEAGTNSFGEGIVKVCEQELPRERIPVYVHFAALQTDYESCWSQTMKAAVTVTRRNRDERGNWAEFQIPNLIDELESRRIEISSPTGVTRVRALPEIAKMAQKERLVAQHSGCELDTLLRDSKHGLTLRAFLERHTYDTRNTSDQPVRFLDYTRQKGERYAEIIQIEAWSEEIRRVVGAEAWGAPQQTEFANRMKQIVRGAGDGAVR
jgi:hypothetical protein